jgi:succinoglycan biosynthesis protein ExoV
MKLQLLMFREANGTPNFGDDLNLIFWQALAPKAFIHDNVDARPFTGIGTLLYDTMPNGAVIFGSGAGYFPAPRPDPARTVVFVRGLWTAGRIGVDASLAITDPAILARRFWKQESGAVQVGFMPRWPTANRDENIPDLCRQQDLLLLDPRRPVADLMSDFVKCKHVFTEAFHGAVVADALRIPWTPLRRTEIHDFKWIEWCATVGLPFEPVPIPLVSRNHPMYLSSDRRHEQLFSHVMDKVAILREI